MDRLLESWHGNLKPGDRLPIDTFDIRLRWQVGRWPSFHNGGVHHRGPQPEGDPKVNEVTGRRLVLFLIEGNGEGKTTAFTAGWRPAGLWERFDTAAAWVEGGQVFAQVQLRNPGPSEMVLIGESEEAFRRRVFGVRAARDVFDRASAEKDEGVRAARLSRMPGADVYAHGQLIKALAGCGRAGTAALGEMLADLKYDDYREMLYGTLVKLPGGRDEIATVLAGELAYWKDAAARGADWLRKDTEAGKRYSRIDLLLSAAGVFTRPPGGKQTVLRDLQALWETHPALIAYEKGMHSTVAGRITEQYGPRGK